MLAGAEGPQELLDDNTDTYVVLDKGRKEIILATPRPITLNRFVLREAVPTHGERVEQHALDIWKDNGWQEIARSTNIGRKRILRFGEVTASKFRIRIHPLFLAAGIASVFTGDLMLFLAATVAALEHECAHAFAARRYGFALDKLVLMPYGAVLSGDILGIGKKQELAVLAAGPIVNALTALAFAALWWLFPETYPYTEAAAQVSFSLFLVNLLPAYPLDGGRMLHLALSPLGDARAGKICRIVTFVIAAGVLGYFVWTCFSVPAYSALLFAILLGAGAFGGGKYARMTFSRQRHLARGLEERRVVIAADRTVQDAFRFLREERYLVLVLYENGEYLGELSEEEYLCAVEEGKWRTPLLEFLPKF